MLKRIFAFFTVLAMTIALTSSGVLPLAHAAVSVTTAPASVVTSPLILPANSTQTELFTFTINADASETLSSIIAEVDAANASTTVTGSHLAELSLYKDDGSNSFNATPTNLVGNQTSVNIGSPTTITPATTTPAIGKFYLSLATSGSWSGTVPVDSITVSMPSGAVNTSANSPEISPVTTAAISAQTASSSNFNVTVAKYVNGQPASTAISNGDTFSAHITYPSGEGDYILGPMGINNPNSYQITSNVPSGDNYSVYENIYGAVGSSCTANLPYVLSGYTTGTTLAQAASATPSSTMPTFNNLSSDEYVIIWNSSCSNNLPPPITTSTVTTQLSSSSVASGTPVNDSAVLSNLTANAGGTLTYNVYAGTMCTGTPVWNNTQTVTNGTAPNSDNFIPSAAGTYNWQAVYSGDSSNQSAMSSCGSETLSVNQTSMTCSNGIINGDTYQVTGKNGGKFIGINCTLQPVNPPKPKGDGDGDGDDRNGPNGGHNITPPVMPKTPPIPHLNFGTFLGTSKNKLTVNDNGHGHH